MEGFKECCQVIGVLSDGVERWLLSCDGVKRGDVN